MVSYSGHKVLVLGGAGFVGGRLAERLLVESHASVRVLVRQWNKAAWISRTGAELVPGDALDRRSLQAAVDGCSVVFHCASGTMPNGGYTRVNVEGTRNVLDACRAASVRRLVYVSSVAVHGSTDAALIDEDSPRPLTGRDYSDSKILAENLLLDAFREDRFPVVIVRPTYVWGPRSTLFTVRQLLEMRQAAFRYVNDGRGTANTVYIDNLVDALMLAGVSDAAVGEAFLVTDGHAVSWKEFFAHYQNYLGIPDIASVDVSRWPARVAGRVIDEGSERLERLAGTPAPLTRRVVRRGIKMVVDRMRRRHVSLWDATKYARRTVVDISKARTMLGYAPAWSLEEGMAETLRWVGDQMAVPLGRPVLP